MPFAKAKRVKAVHVPKKADPADEIDLLTTSFKQMATRIQAQMDQLKNSDKERREMVANVSHDLRTPLATLRGYIETLLLKEEDLSREKRRYYLEIAIRHCERLSKLVDELMELAKLESLETKVSQESFNLAELAQDVTQKFRLRAEEKGSLSNRILKKKSPSPVRTSASSKGFLKTCWRMPSTIRRKGERSDSTSKWKRRNRGGRERYGEGHTGS
jgi:signal transduction histidine kinase